MLLYCGQTVGWNKMKLGMQVGLGPGHIVLDGDRAPPSKGAQPTIFGSYLLCPNGWMDYDATWYGGRPQPRQLCVRWGPSSFSPKRGRTYPKRGTAPNFQPMSIVAKRQTAGWIKMTLGMEVGLGPGHIVLDGDPAPMLQKGNSSPLIGP